MDRNSGQCRVRVQPEVNSAPSAVRQKAIASAGAVVAAMMGAEVEMKKTATASSPSWGRRPSAGGATGLVTPHASRIRLSGR